MTTLEFVLCVIGLLASLILAAMVVVLQLKARILGPSILEKAATCRGMFVAARSPWEYLAAALVSVLIFLPAGGLSLIVVAFINCIPGSACPSNFFARSGLQSRRRLPRSQGGSCDLRARIIGP